MSDGSTVTTKAHDAADAIGRALKLCPTLTVTECFTGTPDMSGIYSGRTDFEVPPHKPLAVQRAEERSELRAETPAFDFLHEIDAKAKTKDGKRRKAKTAKENV